MKDYLQPAATFALALAIASVPFTLPRMAEAQLNSWMGTREDPIHIYCVVGCR